MSSPNHELRKFSSFHHCKHTDANTDTDAQKEGWRREATEPTSHHRVFWGTPSLSFLWKGSTSVPETGRAPTHHTSRTKGERHKAECRPRQRVAATNTVEDLTLDTERLWWSPARTHRHTCTTQRHRHRHTYAGKHMRACRHRQTDRHRHTYAEKHMRACRHRQTDRHRDRDRHRHKETHASGKTRARIQSPCAPPSLCPDMRATPRE